MKRTTRAAHKDTVPRAPRSPKAGHPPTATVAPPRVRRRQRTAEAAVKKDTMILQPAKGARVIWGVTKPKVKKR